MALMIDKETKEAVPVTAFLKGDQLAKDIAKVNDAARGKFLTIVGMALCLMKNYDPFQSPTHFKLMDLLKKFVIGLFTIYGLGFLGYSFVPAAGPCHALAAQYSVPLTGGWITGWNAAVVAKGSNGVDVFPSLHCAVSCFLLFFDRRHRPWRYRIYLLPCIGLWFSTIYLRYHYLVDVICGFALAAFALWLASRFPMKSYEIHTPVPGSPSR